MENNENTELEAQNQPSCLGGVSGSLQGFNITVIENNFAAQDGKALLMLSSRDYNNYVNKLKGNECPKCGVVPAKGGGCINHADCPFRQ